MFLFIILEVLIPILLLILLGVVLQIKFQFDLKQLSTLITYCLMPASVFVNILNVNIKLAVLLQIIYYVVLYSLILIIFTHIICRLLKLNPSQGAALKNSISLMNSGNYGLPVNNLIFNHNPIGVSIQVFILIFQNLLTYTYGIYNILSATKTLKEIIISFLRLPVFHALIVGIIFNFFNITVPKPILLPLNHLADAFIAIALIVLGAQLAKIKINFSNVLLLGLFLVAS